MNLKQFTRISLPYAVIFVLLGAMAATLLWSDPIAWLQQVLAINGYWLSLSIYGVVMMAAIVLAPLSIAVIIPFMAEIFGAFPIFMVTWFSWFVGSIIAFVITRRFGRPIAGRLFSLKRLERLERRLPKNMDFWVLLLLRLFIPADVLSYAVGLLSKISFRKYVSATAIGIIPFAFILSFGPEALTSGNTMLLFMFFAVSGLIGVGLVIFYFSDLLRPKVWIYTHDGKFHADEVTAIAVLELILEQQQRRYEVIRTRDVERITFAKEKAKAGEEVYIIDVGDEYDSEHHLFDHHQQSGAGARENGIEYASLGLVWKEYGIRLCENNAEVVDEVDKQFIQAIDASDNAREIYTLNDLQLAPITTHTIIESYYNYHDKWDELMQNSRFYDAVKWMKDILPYVIGKAANQVELRKEAGKVYAEADNKELIISEQQIGRQYFTRFEDALLIVSPRRNDPEGAWAIVAVPQAQHQLRGRISFPQEWWGLRGEDLQQVSGIEGADFCHRSGDFLCVASNKEAAIKMAEQTLKLGNRAVD